MAVPAVPGTGLVMVEPELIFRGFKAFLNPPARSFDLHQRLQLCPLWAPGCEMA